MERAEALAIANDALAGKVRGHKYHAKPTVVDNVRFASKAEASRYEYLKFLQLAGDIRGLAIQQKWPLYVNDTLIANYFADFVYRTKDGALVVEDVKGMLTPVYRLKKKLMKACHGIEITEVRA